LSIGAKLRERTRNIYHELLTTLHVEYNEIFTTITNFVANIDVFVCGAKLVLNSNYCVPTITSSDERQSFINATELRNPIIEHTIRNQQLYVPNDVLLDSKNLGMILYGVNSSGKSTFLKSVGMSVVLAQAGLPVPATQFEYNVFTNIFCRIGNHDNPKLNLSSFQVEMLELRSIIRRANAHSLVLCDELCCSTEEPSAVSISAASIDKFLNTNVKFIFATHIHKLHTVPKLKNRDELLIRHLHTERNSDNIIYDRHLRKGPSEVLYGLEVATHIIGDVGFNKTALSVRRWLLHEQPSIVNTRTSHFNNNHYMTECEVCGCANQSRLETHHINQQSLADCRGMINSTFHKNHKANLVTLCRRCHHNGVHKDLITIRGWCMSASGIVLDYDVDSSFDVKKND
jgi:DNA mismatch repair protein MutS